MIDKSSTGIYIAYPTTRVLKPIYRGYKTKVNSEHTKIGITKDSFESREKSYLKTFDNEVEFIPIVALSIERLVNIEKIIIERMLKKYTRVGRTKEWFNTDDRESIIRIIQIAINE